MKSKFEIVEFSYTDEETRWLIENIGHEEANIRDEIVYMSLARGLYENKFTLEQFDYLKNQTIGKELLFYKMEEQLPSSLIRTFAALLNAALVGSSKGKNSKYYQMLSKEEYHYFFDAAIKYLQTETDLTGYSPKHGWVHGYAHGADFLAEVVCHEYFSNENTSVVLDTIMSVIKKLEEPFIDGEERRLAAVIYRGILEEKFTQTAIAEWINQAHFEVKENKDFYQLAMFENLLAAIYFHLIDEIEIVPELKTALLKYLKRY